MVELKLLKEMIDWKRVVIVQCIGYLIAVLMLPITIRIIIDEFMGGKSYMTFHCLADVGCSSCIICIS